jgi:SAM-dependent methyltransferase
MALKGRLLRRVLPRPWYDWLLTAKQSSQWRLEKQWHEINCENEYNQPWLSAALMQVQQHCSDAVSVLEFGCSAAHNYRTIEKMPEPRIGKYCGVDINRRAIKFARTRYPEASFHVGDHMWFIKNALKLGSFDLFIASHVLYYIDEMHVRLLLDKARQISRVCVVVCKMDYFEASSGQRCGLFYHPYKRICDELDLEVLELNRNLELRGGIYGYFIARSQGSAPVMSSAGL